MEVKEYLFTLGVRPAELSGLKELPGGTKDRLTPLLLLAPWLSTSPLSRAFEKFEVAYPSRPYFVDVDTYYQVNNKPNDAKVQWEKLAQKPADLDLWWNLLSGYTHANPCLLTAEQPIEMAQEQIEWAREKDRSFCLRINFAESIGSGAPNWMPELIKQLTIEGANDYAVVFEFGWVEDPFSIPPLVNDYTASFLGEISPQVPIVISCTSFPKEFTQFNGIGSVPFEPRKLIAQVQGETKTNHPRIIYGDWGTTRPRHYGHASQPKNRIDYPTNDAWIIARDQDENVDFQTAAARITGSDFWLGNMGIWGEQQIEGTAAGQAFAIDTMPKMMAARINIHLHRQAFYGNLPLPEALDEEWRDEDF